MANKRRKIFKTRYFGLIIGASVAIVIATLDLTTSIFTNLNIKANDIHFFLKNFVTATSKQEGVRSQQKNENVSEDIVIVGVDSKTLDRYGKWPFNRSVHADFFNSLSRIKRKTERERSILFDVFILEADKNPSEDELFIESVRENGRVYMEVILDRTISDAHLHSRMLERQEIINERFGEISNISGPWQNVQSFSSLFVPLPEFSKVIAGYGHANYIQDFDERYRRQILITKYSIEQELIPINELNPEVANSLKEFERLAWFDQNGVEHQIKIPLTDKDIENLNKRMEKEAPTMFVDTSGDGIPDVHYLVIRKFRDRFVPAITLSLAMDYFNVSLNDIRVIFGKHIVLSRESQAKPDIVIPIDEQGQMVINFIGPRSSATSGEYMTFPIRSYATYAASAPSEDPATWRNTKALGGKIVMVGAFADGMAQDEKPTPYGLMYGIEIHANALNTIIMNKFLIEIPKYADIIMLVVLILIISFLTSRFSTLWSLLIVSLSLILHFLSSSFLFEQFNLLIDFPKPAIGMAFSFITIVSYRAMTEEKDKKQIRATFGKYVSPKVVDQMIDNPPELGGVDKEITVLFSDIRGFTSLSETLTPQELVNHLNIYLTAMTDTILEYGGTLDKYVGDEIMCFWGAPLPQKDHALLACKCAIRQMQRLDELNSVWPDTKQIHIGIGLNSGVMTVGNMGSPGRMNYTLMGDNVNLGARLEGTNKQYGTGIIISEYTYGLVKDHVTVRELDNIRVKGKNKPVLIYELVDCDDLNPPVLDNNKKNWRNEL